ncbi:hypothetical protein, partial [Escherichia coli]|uniref:hypothetical protein n=1 Tax=Escherichia coli TaxID=562 RepID=UPI0020018D41
ARISTSAGNVNLRYNPCLEIRGQEHSSTPTFDSYKAHKKNQPHNMFFTMFLVIDYVINLQMIMRIFPSVILISHFNISCDSKFIFYIKT